MRNNWTIILAHRHWINLRLSKYEVHICARCLGTTVGYFFSIFILSNIDLHVFNLLPPHWQIILPFLLALPSGIDWLTQTWSLRMSKNSLRLSFGFLVGLGVALLSMSSFPRLTQTVVLTSICFSLVLTGLIGRRLRIIYQHKKYC